MFLVMSPGRLILFKVRSGKRIVHIRAVNKNTACDIFLYAFPDEAIIYCRESEFNNRHYIRL